MGFSNQVHDFDPDINPYPDGLFWTMPIGAIGPVELGTGTAHMSANNMPLKDYFSIPNAIFIRNAPPPVGAMASFDITWSGPVTSRGAVTDTSTPNSTGELVMCSATMTWSASNDLGFTFVSDPSPTTSVFAQLGHISNGVFASG